MPSNLLFLPGLLCDAHLWHHQAEALAGAHTIHIADLTQDDTIQAMAARTLASAPAAFTLIALSMGGYVAFEILRQAPSRVTKLILLDTSASLDTPDKVTKRKAGIASLKLGRFMGVTNSLLPNLIHPKHIGQAVGDDVKAMALRVGGEAYIRQQTAILNRPDSHPTLPTITVPTLIGVGDSDLITPLPEAQAMHAAIPHATLHVFNQCGHLPPLENPEETTTLIQTFLTA
ncbi:MAG: alpha/beta fold hydrolase [Alphaproteobacteria bacterium]|nr:MAG: alpha/beta fold hydrolase [Alphaproteobacteria bacterium]